MAIVVAVKGLPRLLQALCCELHGAYGSGQGPQLDTWQHQAPTLERTVHPKCPFLNGQLCQTHTQR